MKTMLIINPYSGNKSSGQKSKVIMNYFRKINYQFDYRIVEKFSDAYDFSRVANMSGFDNIVAIGGDGTINKVINGFYDEAGRRISESRLGVIHTGTSPDFCKSYNIPLDALKAAQVIVRQQTKDIPVGMIRMHSKEQNDDAGDDYFTAYFVCCANIGLGAALARSAGSGIRGYLGDFLGTFVSFLKILISYRGTEYEMYIDNEYIKLQNVFNISAGITPFIASGIKVPVDGNNREGSFYILKAADINLSNIIQLLWRVYSGNKFRNRYYLSLTGAMSLKISYNPIHPEIEFDGDPAGFLPCEIEIAKDKLSLLS